MNTQNAVSQETHRKAKELFDATPSQVKDLLRLLTRAGAEAYHDYRMSNRRFYVSLACNIILLAVLFFSGSKS